MVDYIVFFVLTLIAEIVGTIGGFGSSLFFVSISQFFYDFQTVLALTGLLHIFQIPQKLYSFRKKYLLEVNALWLGVSSMLLAITEACIAQHMDFLYAKMLMAFFLITFSSFFFLKPAFSLFPTLKNSILGGAVSGFLAGFIGTGGAIRGLVLAAFNLEKNIFVGTSAAIDFGVDLSRTVIYLNANYLAKKEIWYIPVLLVAAFLGSYLGKRLLNKIPQETFKKIVLGLIFLMGVSMMVNQWKNLF